MSFAQQSKYYGSRLLKPAMLVFVFLLADACGPSDSKKENSTVLPYLNTELGLEERVNDLVGRMTLEEKISQMVNQAAAIERLGRSGIQLVVRRFTRSSTCWFGYRISTSHWARRHLGSRSDVPGVKCHLRRSARQTS